MSTTTHLKEGALGKVVILSTGTLTSARTESALSAFPLRSFSKYLLRGHNLYQTIHIYTSACCEVCGKVHCDYRLLYINTPKKQNSQYYKKKYKKYFVIREKVSTFAASLVTISTSSTT